MSRPERACDLPSTTPNRFPANQNVVPVVGVGTVARLLTLALATLTTGLISGFYYACSVTLALALLPDEQYVEAM
jgi:hypothetical protein